MTRHVLDTAVRYTQWGWSVIPVPHRSKNPGFRGWQHLRLAEDDLPQHFNGEPQNIGVLTGEPSGWLIDVDLDHLLAVEMASDHLPPTAAVFGRSGKPCSICMLASADPCATLDASIEVGNVIFLNTIWNLRVEGAAPGGATARIHSTADRCHAFNN